MFFRNWAEGAPPTILELLAEVAGGCEPDFFRDLFNPHVRRQQPVSPQFQSVAHLFFLEIHLVVMPNDPAILWLLQHRGELMTI
jgi:hypothetical protein